MEAKQSEVGRYYVGNQSWPAQNRTDFEVKIGGYIQCDEDHAHLVQYRLAAILGDYGLTVSVEPIQVVFLNPEDQTEYYAALDRQAAAGRN